MKEAVICGIALMGKGDRIQKGSRLDGTKPRLGTCQGDVDVGCGCGVMHAWLGDVLGFVWRRAVSAMAGLVMVLCWEMVGCSTGVLDMERARRRVVQGQLGNERCRAA